MGGNLIMEGRKFERELPAGYKEAKYLNAKNFKFGIIMNLIAFVVMILVVRIALLFIDSFEGIAELFIENIWIYYLVFIGGMIGYIVLHELVHGIVYKLLTKEKLTFGFSWSCAYCGVPNIYTYRKTAILALIAPLITFTFILFPLMLVFLKIDVIIYLILSFIFGLHLGGCSGDIYGFLLFMFKYRDPKTLMRDTGPEQFFYIKE